MFSTVSYLWDCPYFPTDVSSQALRDQIQGRGDAYENEPRLSPPAFPLGPFFGSWDVSGVWEAGWKGLAEKSERQRIQRALGKLLGLERERSELKAVRTGGPPFQRQRTHGEVSLRLAPAFIWRYSLPSCAGRGTNKHKSN